MDEKLKFEDRNNFRKWLTDNCNKNTGIWLEFSKSKMIKSISAEEALEEALCFGWIDGQIKSIDEKSYIKKFTPRRKGSLWSEKNKKTALELIEKGLMTETGLLAIEQAKKGGQWDSKEAAPIGEADILILINAIKGVEPAYSNFLNMSISIRKTYTAHYLSAKTDATRERRLEQIIGRLNENKKPM